MNNFLSALYATLSVICQQISTACEIFDGSLDEDSSAAEVSPSSTQSFDIPFDQELLAIKAGEAAGICYGLVITWYSLWLTNLELDFLKTCHAITTALKQQPALALDPKQQSLLDTVAEIQKQHLLAPERRMNKRISLGQTYTVIVSEQETFSIKIQELDQVFITAMEKKGKLYGIQCKHAIEKEGHLIGVVAGQENNQPYVQCFDANFGRIRFLNSTIAAEYCKHLLETNYAEYPALFIKEFTAKTLMLCLEPDEKTESKPSNKLRQSLNDRYLMAEQLLLTNMTIIRDLHHLFSAKPYLFVPVLRTMRQSARQSYHIAKQELLDTYQAVKTIQTLTTRNTANTFEVALYKLYLFAITHPAHTQKVLQYLTGMLKTLHEKSSLQNIHASRFLLFTVPSHMETIKNSEQAAFFRCSDIPNPL